MSFYSGVSFFLLLIAFMIPALFLGILGKSLKLYSFFISLIFIFLVLRDDPIQLIYLTLFYCFSLLLVTVFFKLRQTHGKKTFIFALFVLLSLAPLIVSKVSGLFLHNIFGFLGISYLTFKVVQVVIEIHDGVIKELHTFSFSSFLLFFPVFSSGPIDRSRRFEADLNRIPSRDEYLELAGQGLVKIIWGGVYKFVLSAIFYGLLNEFADRLTVWSLIGYAYAYGIYLFFDFAGYSSMAVGVSYLLGIRTPDNFNKPFISIDIRDFWNRWHITLSHWFRDFLFSRFMMTAIRKKWFSSRLTGAAIGFIVNMLVMGIWHGLTSYYILYGAFHGILLAVTEIYQKKSRFYARYKNNRAYKLVSWFFTLNAVMLGFLIFSGRFHVAAAALIQKIF